MTRSVGVNIMVNVRLFYRNNGEREKLGTFRILINATAFETHADCIFNFCY